MASLLLLVTLLQLGPPVSPNSLLIASPALELVWQITAVDAATAALFVYALTVDVEVPVTVSSVSCAATPDPAVQACRAPASGVPLGARVLTLTAFDGQVTSDPSLPYRFVALIIPVP